MSDPTVERRAEPQRGRDATGPGDIPASGWKDVFVRVGRRARDHDLASASAGVAFYALIATFPGLRALLELYALVFDMGDWSTQLARLRGHLQPEAMRLLIALVRSLVDSDPSHRGFGVASGALVTFWGASLALRALIRALNLAYGEREQRAVLHRQSIALLLTAGAIAVAFCVGVALVAPVLLGHWLGWPPLLERVVLVARWPAIGLLFWLSLLAFYRYGPCRTNARWSWLAPGALLATVPWLAATAAVAWYVQGAPRQHLQVRTADLLVIVLAWFLVSAFSVLLGAECDAELERQTRRDTTVGPERAAGERGAAAADDLGASA